MEGLIEPNEPSASVRPNDAYSSARPRNPAMSLERSREIAVRRIFRGRALVLGGAGLFAATGALYGVTLSTGLPFALGMGAMALGGAGLVELGRAATHLKRYGSRASLAGFAAVAGLGVSTVTAAVANWIGVAVGGEIWLPVVHWAMNGVYTLGVVVLLMVLRVLVLWALDRTDEGTRGLTGAERSSKRGRPPLGDRPVSVWLSPSRQEIGRCLGLSLMDQRPELKSLKNRLPL